jgi:hypothetical protein
MERGDNRPAGVAGPLSGQAALADPQEAILGYVQQLDRVVAEAREAAIDDALAALEHVEPPRGLAVGHLLERKRRELLARFERARHQTMRVGGSRFGPWLDFFLTSAEMAGCDHVEVRWRRPPRGARAVERIPVAEGRAWRMRLSGTELADVSAIAHVAPGEAGQAMLDAEGGWLTLYGPSFFATQSQRALDAATHEAPLALSLVWDHAKEVLEGAGLVTRITVTNVSDDVLVLDQVATDLPYDAPEHFRRASMGALTFDEAEGAYVYDASAPQPTPAAFFTAVLRPGQTRTIMLVVKMLEGGDAWREIRVRYARFDEATFAREAFVPAPGRVDAFPPVVAYRRLGEQADPRQVDLTTVLLPGVPEAAWREAAWAFPFHAARRRFSLAQARARVGEDALPVHYSRWQQAWIMATQEGCAVVAPSRVTLYPRVDPSCFVLIDDAEQRVPIRFAEPVLPVFRSLPLGISDWESHALGLSVSLPKLKLTSLFQEVDRLGCAMGVGRNLLGRPTIVIGP